MLKHKARLDLVLLLLLGALLLSGNWLWLKQVETLPHGDQLTHLILSQEFARGLDLQASSPALNMTKPPLLYFWTALGYRILGNSRQVAGLSLSCFWLILIYSAFGIGKYLGGRFSGWATALLCLTSLPLMHFSHLYLPDFPLLAMVALSSYCYLRCENFSHKAFTLLFGLSLGLGALIKYSFAYFMLLPALYLYARAWWTGAPSLGRRLGLPAAAVTLFALAYAWAAAASPFRYFTVEQLSWYVPLALEPVIILLWMGLSLGEKPGRPREQNAWSYGLKAALLALAVAGPWYLPRLPLFYKDIFYHIVDYPGQTADFGANVWRLNLESCFYFLRLFPVLLPLGIWEACNRKLLTKLWPLLLNILCSYALISLTLPAEPRHIIPLLALMLPFFALGWLWAGSGVKLLVLLLAGIAAFNFSLPEWSHRYSFLTERSTSEQRLFCSRAGAIGTFIARNSSPQTGIVLIVHTEPAVFATRDSGMFETEHLRYMLALKGVKSAYAEPGEAVKQILRHKVPARSGRELLVLLGSDPDYFAAELKPFKAEGLQLAALQAWPLLNGWQAQLYEVLR